MVIDTTVNIQPTEDQLINLLLERDMEFRARFFYDLFVNYGWDEEGVVSHIDDYMEDIDTMIFTMENMVALLKQRYRR